MSAGYREYSEKQSNLLDEKTPRVYTEYMRFQAVNSKYDNSKVIENKRNLWESRDISLAYDVNGAELIDKKAAEAFKKRETIAREKADAMLLSELNEAERRIRAAEERARELELANKLAEAENARLSEEKKRTEQEAKAAKLEAERAKSNAAVAAPPPRPSYSTPAPFRPTQPVNNKSNNASIIGFILSLIWLQPFGFILSIIGRNKATKDGCPHGGLAIAGIVISVLQVLYVAIAIFVALIPMLI